jgi:hypothetical protein
MIRNTALVAVVCLLFAGAAPAAETFRQGEQREAVRKQLEIRLSEVNQKLNRLMSRSSSVPEESKKELSRQNEELAKKREVANRSMSELGSAQGQDWERLKAETNAAIDDLNRSCDRMQSLFKGI